MKRVNVAGWLFVVLVALLVEAGVRAFDYEQSIAPPSSTLRALYNRLADGTLSGEIGITLHAYLEGLAIALAIYARAPLLDNPVLRWGWRVLATLGAYEFKNPGATKPFGKFLSKSLPLASPSPISSRRPSGR